MSVDEFLINDHLNTLLVCDACQEWLDPAVLVFSILTDLLIFLQISNNF